MSDTADSTQRGGFRVRVARGIDEIEPDVWDGFVPRDEPHLRSGFLRAAESSGQSERCVYLTVTRGDDDNALVAVAAAYGLRIDLLTLAPRRQTRGIHALRRRFFPGLLYLDSLTCGPVVTNCHHNIYIDPALGDEAYEVVAEALLDTLEGLPGYGQLLVFFEFAEPQASRLAPVMIRRGYLRGVSLPGTRLDVRWDSLDGYVALLRKAFRRTVLKDRARASGLTFEIVDDFSTIADDAWRLYANVLERADSVLEELTAPFFRALAAFEQSRMVVARDRETGRVVGMELLLRGDTTLQDIYTGLDYAYNPDQHLYFNLIYPVIGYAGEQGFRRISFGQTSYTFKARLGVTPYPTYVFVRHRNRLVQRVLAGLRNVLFPATKTTTFHVFRDEPSKPEAPG